MVKLQMKVYTIGFYMPATYVDKLIVVTLLQVMQYGSVVEVCQVGHILSLLVLGGVHLLDLLLLQGLFL